MAVCGPQGQAVDFPELFNLAQGLCGEGRLPLKHMQNDAFQQVTQAHVLQLSHGLEDLEHAFFQSDAGLYAFDFQRVLVINHLVPMYQSNKKAASKLGSDHSRVANDKKKKPSKLLAVGEDGWQRVSDQQRVYPFPYGGLPDQ